MSWGRAEYYVLAVSGQWHTMSIGHLADPPWFGGLASSRATQQAGQDFPGPERRRQGTSGAATPRPRFSDSLDSHAAHQMPCMPPTCVCLLLRGQLGGAMYGHARPLRGDEFRTTCVAEGSAVPVQLIELRSYRVNLMSIRAGRPRAAALENGHARAAVGLWRLYSESGHRRGDFVTDRKTGYGRQEPAGPRPVSSLSFTPRAIVAA